MELFKIPLQSMIFNLELSKNQLLKLGPEFTQTIAVKREDLIHPQISGNKYRKLKYNLAFAQKEQFQTLLTFGGAFSNHICAVAASGKQLGFQTVGIIRGEELEGKIDQNPTLKFAHDCGMRFMFVDRETFRNKTSAHFIEQLHKQFGDFYLIPEGGTNEFAIKGCEEILDSEDLNYDYICCAVGTGGTISGIINASKPSQKILGFPALKGDFLKEEISKFAKNKNWQLIQKYHFGGYAKINSELISFINQFKSTYQIPLDSIYTGKLMFGVMDLLKSGYFAPHSKILVIHTGGIQGIAGMNDRLAKKNMPLID